MSKPSEFDAGRISAISDGVFAIAMTLLVLDLKLPDLEIGMSREDFATVTLRQAPRFVSWLLSFAILARLWMMQYGLLVEGDTRSRGFVGWTFVFLGAVSFTPFPTSLLSEHHDQALSTIVFSATLAVAAIALLGMASIERQRRQASAAERTAGRWRAGWRSCGRCWEYGSGQPSRSWSRSSPDAAENPLVQWASRSRN